MNSANINTRRMTGMGMVATLALAVLVFGCVLAATAGPREALNTRTQALQQALATLPALGQAITVSAPWDSVEGPYNGPTLPDSLLANLQDQFHGDFSKGVLDLAPVSADWMSMTSTLQNLDSNLPGTQGYPVSVEVSYRLPLTGYVRVLAGSLSVPAPASVQAGPGAPAGVTFPTINVAVTRQTADKFGLKVGSVVRIADLGPGLAPVASNKVRLKVTAIVTQRQPVSAFWEADPSLEAPQLNVPGNGPDYWTSGVFALPDESAALQADYGPGNLDMQWVLPVDAGAMLGDQAQALAAAFQGIVSQYPRLTGPLALAASSMAVNTDLQRVLGAFIDSADAVDVLLWLLYVSLAVTAAAVLLLAARMIALRRATELALLRSRGASLFQIGLASGRGAAIGSVPAAVVAAAVAVVLVPGPTPPGGWWPGLAVLAVAVGAPAVLGAWRQRLPRSGKSGAPGGYTRPGQPSLAYGALGYGKRNRRRFRGGGRLVLEVTAVLAAIAGILVFRQQGNQPGAGVNLLTSAAPALVAIPAVIIVLRVYPLVLRGLLRGAARGRGAAGFVGLARAARAVLTPALAAFALVLAITVAAFAGMVRDAVTHGDIDASWQAAGADVVISETGQAGAISAAAQRAFASVPGVEHTAIVSQVLMTAPNGGTVTALFVDPASYSALVATEQAWPAVDPGLLTGNAVLASPQALADFAGVSTQTLTMDNGVAPVQVRIAGTLSGTPALTSGGAFLVMPESLAAHEPFVVPNLMLLNGPGIDTARLTALVDKVAPNAVTTLRSDILRQLTDAPAQHGALLLFALAVAVAAGLGLVVMLLQLALGAADRESALARLATMGIGEGQRTWMVLLEVLPAVAAAAVAAVATALVLPRVVAPAINLSVFTGSSASVPLVASAASIALPIAGLVVVVAVTLAIEIRARRGVVATLRADD